MGRASLLQRDHGDRRSHRCGSAVEPMTIERQSQQAKSAASGRSDIGDRERVLTVCERERIPLLDWLFAFGPMVPFMAGAIALRTLPEPSRSLVLDLVVLWAAAILLFLSGVRRGLSFRTEGGPTMAQIVTMTGLFFLGFLALVLARSALKVDALAVLLVGYVAVILLDPIAARRGEAPLHFGRLRLLQIPIALASLAAMLWQAF